jgi:hypothetical protein
MKFVGLLLKESLQDESILDLIRVTKTETWHVEGDVDSEIWTALSFEGDAGQADAVAEKMSLALKPRWYINFSTEDEVYVIFQGRVFKYTKSDQKARAEVVAYGQGQGIPDDQLDWWE